MMTDTAWLGLETLTLIGMFAIAFACWRLVAHNIRLSAKLAQAAETLRHAEELGQIGTWRIDVDNQRVHWSDRVFEIHERSPSLPEPPLDDAIDYYHEEDRPMVARRVERAMENGVSFEFTARLISEAGTEKNVLTRGLCRINSKGEVDQVFGVFIETAHVIELAEFVNDNLGIGVPDAVD